MTRLRISAELHRRAKECADAIQEPLAEWVRCCVIGWRKGLFASVSDAEKTENTTYGGAVISIYETDMAASDLRQIMEAGVVYAESRRVKFRDDINTKLE